ncbi:hypothetical protein MTY66_61910 (plasmid) [Mycolicibacterium sp. TY66]|uniref:hypothetical protein n=1 Tax=unclassified Mycolicibacterium TaxID=2636767 RepID=UPI001BB30B63|nr:MULTISPECIES: hypothetical protein [unclassified Mycolicibacterium]BCI84566.1 hypothetical protein MTY66_61910 [Mycolicibacterium sp. TY66]BCJ84796.1 hypothetical protein MTY81_61690 [Mycolicibacterium sp. TY81]
MDIEKDPDPYDLIQQNWPTDSEQKFAASAAWLSGMQDHHKVMVGTYRDVMELQGTHDFFGDLTGRHEAEEQYLQKLSAAVNNCSTSLVMCKHEINSTCAIATTKIGQLETQKAAATEADIQQRIQRAIDDAKKHARDDIAALNDELEDSLTAAATAIAGQEPPRVAL